MKINSFLRVLIIFSVIILIYLYWASKPDNIIHNELNVTEASYDKILFSGSNKVPRNMSIVVAVVACGDRLKETLNMLKSAIMFTKSHLNFVVVCEEKLTLDFEEKPLTFPKDNSNEWRRLFKPCAAQRLFLPSILTNIDSILYVDTDTLFLTALETVWEHFYKMNSSQMAALAPEHEDPNVGWYNRFARHPYYGALEFKWTEYVVPIYKKYKLKITWGDQDIINIIFHYHPDKLYIYPCRYNFRPDHCMYMSVCKSAEQHGVTVLHGSRGFFHSEKQPVFQAIYRAFEEYQLGGDINKGFLMPLETYLESTSDSNCGHVRHIFVKNVKKYHVTIIVKRKRTIMLNHVRKLYSSTKSSKFMRHSFDKIFGKYLLTTNIVSSGVLLGVGDLVQQEFEYRKKLIPKRYDYERVWRMFLVGLAQGPMHHYFYKYLDKFLPKQNLNSVGKKILVDQFVASPLFIISFFYGMGLLEGKCYAECKEELRAKFVTVYAMDWFIWPPTQFINFYYLAPQYRVLYINFITMVYDIFLSYVKHKDAHVLGQKEF
ncbi:shams [Carabus blaptoides fortunei]